MYELQWTDCTVDMPSRETSKLLSKLILIDIFDINRIISHRMVLNATLYILYPDSVLEGGNGICKREYEEALMLLKDMKRKYRTAHLKRVEQAAQIENEMMCNLNQQVLYSLLIH